MINRQVEKVRLSNGKSLYTKYKEFKRSKPKKINRSFGGNSVINAILLLFGVFMGLPMLYAIISAFKPLEELFVYPPRFFVRHPTIENFTLLFQHTAGLWVPFLRYVFNSIFICVIGTAGNVLFSSMAAYPLAKHNFPGKKLVFGMIVLSLLFSPKITLVPQYIIMAKLGWVNTYLSLIVPAIAVSLGIYLMKQFMEQIPVSTLESARIDGASEYRTFWSIVMPSVKPAWLTLIVFSFQNIWGNNGSAFIYNESLKVLPSVFAQISSGGIVRAGVGAAGSLFLLVPPVLVFILTQRSVIETMVHAGIKE